MRRRTASGTIVEPAAPVATPAVRWEAWDEWGDTVVLSRVAVEADSDAIGKWFLAPDAAAAAELALVHLASQGLVDEGMTAVDVRQISGRTGFRCRVQVWIDADGEVDCSAKQVEVLR